MYRFAGSFTSEKPMDLRSLPHQWGKYVNEESSRFHVYIRGETDLSSSEDMLRLLRKSASNILAYDISHTGDPDPDLINFAPLSDTLRGRYTCIIIQGSSFHEVVNEFGNLEGVVSIRTAETSRLFGEKNIKIDRII